MRILCDNIKISGNNGFKLKGMIYPTGKTLNTLNTFHEKDILSTNNNNIAQESQNKLSDNNKNININKKCLPALIFEFPEGNTIPTPRNSYILLISISLFVISLIATTYLIYDTAHLFSRGFYSTKFYKGGGTLILVTALEGLSVGLFLGWITRHNFEVSIAVGGPLMCIFISVILIGVRGMLIGGYGGCALGFVLGNMINQSPKINLIAPLLGLPCGMLIGILPIFPGLKINQRYSKKLEIERNRAR